MKNLNQKIADHFNANMAELDLFVVNLTGKEVWDHYINGFENPAIFRDPASNFYDCNHCNNFIRKYGNIVAIDPTTFEIITLFDIELTEDISEYHNSLKTMSESIKASVVKEAFKESYNFLFLAPYEKTTRHLKKFRLGIDKNAKVYNEQEANAYSNKVEVGRAYNFHHFYLDLPVRHVILTQDSVEKVQGVYRSNFQVFKRALDEINMDTFELVIDLINQKSILKAEPYLPKVIAMRDFKIAYDKLDASLKHNWAFLKSLTVPFAKFKNELIGVFCTELSGGEDLIKACKNWNKRVDPINFMKAKSPVTQRQIDLGLNTVKELGYLNSFERKFATLEDINSSQILHINNGSGVIEEVTVFNKLVATKKSNHHRNTFEKVQEVPIETFIREILPKCNSVEAYLDNKHTNNMVSLTTSKFPDEKPMFKYGNNYSQTFMNNLAGKSSMALAVEAKGGRTDVPFRFTHSWNHPGKRNESLMDLHVFMPGCTIPIKNYTRQNAPGTGLNRVGWDRRNHVATQAKQDVDYVKAAPVNKIPVENIVFPEVSKMKDGEYSCYIHNWAYRSTALGFKAEIALLGEVFEYEYSKDIPNYNWIKVATVTLKHGEFTIEHHLPCNQSSKTLYGLETKKFHPVKLVCTSPNHWNNVNIGNKHYLFMLEKCRVDTPIKTFHAVDLVPELQKIRKVLEPLSYTTMVDSKTPGYKKQLSGIGFDATEKAEVILKVKGTHTRMLKVIF